MKPALKAIGLLTYRSSSNNSHVTAIFEVNQLKKHCESAMFSVTQFKNLLYHTRMSGYPSASFKVA